MDVLCMALRFQFIFKYMTAPVPIASCFAISSARIILETLEIDIMPPPDEAEIRVANPLYHNDIVK
jgi:hypothetical protein